MSAHVGRSCFLVMFFALACWPEMALAARYSVLQPERSSIGFTYRQMGAAMDGRFARFSGEVDIDTAALANARAHLDIDMTSVDTGALDANTQLATRPWFNIAAFPRASFVMTRIASNGTNRYTVSGTLDMKGKTRQISAPAVLMEKGGSALFEGEIPVMRADFGIGEGEWADYGLVANEVKVRFSLTVAAAPGKK